MDPAHLLVHNHQSAPAQQHQQSPSATGPQIRSRITVVCAECKRLKLKCDRRAPCGSCTKRDTVVRCIYSPAAAEKVDLHSLNNRLIQVEAILAMITAGQNPPAFQSSYPFSSQTNNHYSPFTSPQSSQTHGLHQHQHHHHYAASPSHLSANDSFALTAHDLASIWLSDLDLGSSLHASSPNSPFLPVPGPSVSSTQRQRAFSNAENTGLIKLEPSPIDLELSRPQPPPQTSAVIDVDGSSGSTRSAYPSRAPSPHKRNPYPPRTDVQPPFQQRRSSTQLLLPALSIYYPLPTIPPPGSSAASSAAFPRHLPNNSTSASSTSPSTSPGGGVSANTGHALPAPQPQYTRPQVTPALLALLPPLQTCRRLLACAREVLRVRPIPFEPVGAGAGSAQGQGQGQVSEQPWHAFERRCLALLGGGASKEKERERERKEREREKAREARRSRQIYFGGIMGTQQQQDAGTDMDVDGGEGAGNANSGGRSSKTSRAGGDSGGTAEDTSGEDQSLTFFALMCAVLAMGASISSPSPSPLSAAPLSPCTTAENPVFLYALSQQALGVWDTHHTTLAASAPSASSMCPGAEEAEKMDFLLACIAGLGYLLLTSAPGRVVGLASGSGSGSAGEEGGSEREGGSGVGVGVGSSVSVGSGLGAGGSGSAALVYTLVGKLVNAARGMGLARDTSVLSSVLSRKGKQPQHQHPDQASGGSSIGLSNPGGASTSAGGFGGGGAGGGGRGPSKREREAERERIREEWKKMIWWEVLLYDLFTADALGHQPYIPAHLFGVKLPACASLSQPPSLMAPAPAPHGDEQESDEDEDDGAGVPMQQDAGSYREKHRTHRQHATPMGPSAVPAGDGAERAEEEYLGARYRLTQLAQTIKNRLLHPDCCCGYTLDQAAALDAEVRQWQAALPASLKWVEEAPLATPPLAPAVLPGLEPNVHANATVAPPFAAKPSASERMKLVQCCELAVIANLLLIKVYTPFLRHAASAGGASNANSSGHGPSGSSSSSSSRDDAAAPISLSALQTTVHAAHAILKAAKEIYGTSLPSSFSSSSQSLLSNSLLSISLSSSPTSSSSPSASPGKTAAPAHNSSHKATAAAAVSPSMFDLYPLDKLVFDAVVICAHAAQVTVSKAAAASSSSLPFVGLGNAALLDDVTVTLAWLLGEHGQGVGGALLGDEQRKIAEALYKRAVCRGGAHHGMKRKHSQVDLTSPFGASSTAYQSAINNPALIPPSGHDWNSVNATQVEQYQQHHSNVVELHSSSPSASRSSVPPLNFPQDNLMRTEHQKQEITSAVRHATARRTEQGDDEKEKKHAKKEKTQYPSVGVRVRPNKDRDNSSRPSRKQSIAGTSSGGNPQPLMTSTPRPLPIADAVLAFQQHQKQKLMVSVQPAVVQPPNSSQSPSVMYDQDLGRSRSSSISHLQTEHAHQHQQQQQTQHQQHPSQSQSHHGDGIPEDSRYPYFGAPTSEVDMHAMHRKRFSIHEQQPHPQHQQQQQQQTHSPQIPFTPSVYDQVQPQSQVMYEAQPYDAGAAVDNTMGYSAVSSPFSNPGAPASSSGSPFATTSALSSGHPSTPTFPPHNPSAPVFGPQPTAPPNSSPTTYFHTPASFADSSYPGTTSSTSHMSHQQHHSSQQSISLSGMNVDQNIISIPSAPQSSYEKQPRQVQVPMYEIKTEVEHHQMVQHQQQMQPHQPMDSSYEEHDMSGQSHSMALGMPGPPTWSSMGQPQQQVQQQQQQQQQHAPPANSEPFWNNGEEYRFYSRH